MAYCGIDPGRDKFGIAMAEGRDGDSLLFSAIAPISRADDVLSCLGAGDLGCVSEWRIEGDRALCEFSVGAIYVGNGTGFDFFCKKLDEKDILYNIINERMTTLEGRALYWKLHPPSGLRRIIPLSLMTPGRPVDDLAAWAILKRGLVGARGASKDDVRVAGR
ncbi:MAG: endonuclease [Synergistaceae bacterium]|jgi:hypothetical protein|nr:endonuclease [Synergistaceae bacterium]